MQDNGNMNDDNRVILAGWCTNAPNSISPPLFMRKIHIVQTCTHFHRRIVKKNTIVEDHTIFHWIDSGNRAERTNNSTANKQANQTFGWVFKWNIFQCIPWRRRRTNYRFSSFTTIVPLSLHLASFSIHLSVHLFIVLVSLVHNFHMYVNIISFLL